MLVRYDKDADVLLVKLRDESPTDAVEEDGGIIISYGDKGLPVSVEFLNASLHGLIQPQDPTVTLAGLKTNMNRVAIDVSFANISGPFDPEDVLEFIEREASGIETYIRPPVPTGAIQAGAVDFVLVLTVGGSIASLASVLWSAYERFIARRKAPSKNTGLILTIRTDDGSAATFWVGEEYRDRDLFVKDFSAKLETTRRSQVDDSATEHRLVEFSRHWVRRK